MTATLTFTLPEEQEEHECAVHGGEYKSVLWDLDQWLREKVKHGHTYGSATEALEAVRKELWEQLGERALRLE